MPRKLIALMIAVVLSFGASSIYVHAKRQSERIAVLEREVARLQNQVGSYRIAIEALTKALGADEQQLRDLNQKPVATIDDVRAALEAIARANNSTTTTTTRTRPTTTSPPTTTTTTTRPPPRTTTTRCLVAPPIC